MITIKSKHPSEISSPAAGLIELIPNAISNIAPERLAELEETYPDLNIIVEDSPIWVFGVDAPGKVVRLSVFCLEVLWATAYSHCLLYQKMIGGRQPDNDFAMAALMTPECRVACQLLNWITQRRLGANVPHEWPAGLPNPSELNDNADQRKLATEIALGALGFIIHHELAHIRLWHSGKSEISSEKDADHAAVDWILRDGSISAIDTADKKRLLCIAHALSVTVVRDIYTGDFDGITHPRSFDRLNYAISRHLTDNNHLSRSFIAFVLKLHMDNSSISYWDQSKEFFGFDEILQSFFDAFADFNERKI